MTSSDSNPGGFADQSGGFPETRWTRVLALQTAPATDQSADQVLVDLCEAYWLPVYAYARRLGNSTHDAEDLTQGFFGMVLARKLFHRADPARGRLRTFLKGAFENYVHEHHRAAGRIKRGGQRVIVSLDELAAEGQLAADPAAATTADAYFDRRWAAAVFERALSGLRAEYVQRGQAELFGKLCGQLTLAERADDTPAPAPSSAPDGGSGAARVAAFRLRQRFRHRVEAEIADTVDSAQALREELRYLAAAYCNGPSVPG